MKSGDEEENDENEEEYEDDERYDEEDQEEVNIVIMNLNSNLSPLVMRNCNTN